MEKIDKLDKQIMEIISANARIPFKDVAAVCGVSRAAIHWAIKPAPMWASDWKRVPCTNVL